MVGKHAFVQQHQQGDIVSIPFLSFDKYASPKDKLKVLSDGKLVYLLSILSNDSISLLACLYTSGKFSFVK